jgi:hypothetical protein
MQMQQLSEETSICWFKLSDLSVKIILLTVVMSLQLEKQFPTTRNLVKVLEYHICSYSPHPVTSNNIVAKGAHHTSVTASALSCAWGHLNGSLRSVV